MFGARYDNADKLEALMFYDSEHVLIDFADIKDEQLAVLGLALASAKETIKKLELYNLEDRHVKFLTMLDEAGGKEPYNYILDTMPTCLSVNIQVTATDEHVKGVYVSALIGKLKAMGHEVPVKRKR